MVSDIRHVLYSICQHARGEEVKQVWGQPCFTTFAKAAVLVAAAENLSCHSVVKQPDQRHKLLWLAVSLQDRPGALLVDCIKGLCEIYKDRVEGLVLFNALLLTCLTPNIMSTVLLRAGLKPHCASGKLLLETVISRFRRMQAKISLQKEIRCRYCFRSRTCSPYSCGKQR